MNPGEHRIMAEVEASHWWYEGLRDVLGKSLAQPKLALPPQPRILDAGCGTGENLRFLRGQLDPSYLAGFDFSEEALVFAREKAPLAEIYRGDICDPEVRVDDLDLIISMDVLYIPGIDRAMEGLHRLADHLRPGGLLVLNLPAFNWLYSEHDVAVHTSERYTEPQVRRLLTELGLSVELSSYRLFFLFPLVLLSRLPSMLRARGQATEEARSELHDPPGTLTNTILGSILRAENSLVASGTRLPWGSSVYAIARKPGASAQRR